MQKSKSVYQLKITLKESHPHIWRRILVPENITLSTLHLILQDVLGWQDYHLHQFIINEQYYGEPDDEFDQTEILKEAKYRLNKFVSGEKFKFTYEYDFGDGWQYAVLVEKILPREKDVLYPICVGGKRACPPEDVGGVWGYEEFLNAIANPKHEEHDHFLSWVGGKFDPETFSADEINQLWREKGLDI